jgi:CrcB protein
MLVMRLPIDPDLAPAARAVHPRRALGLVALGGAAGTLLRALLEHAGSGGHGMPWPTLATNISGAGALALLLVALEERAPAATWPRPLLGVGVLGGYTTFSTFSTQTVLLLHAGRGATAVAYVLASVIGSFVAAIAGVALGRAASRLSAPVAWRRRVRHQAAVGDAAEDET